MGGDRFWPVNIRLLLDWILEEEKAGRIFGIAKGLFFVPPRSNPFKIRRYGQVLETPLGAAAGPQTQMAQNIVSAWLTGARYLELKTVQVLDELNVTKPCIHMADEGYNCEWSQELRLEESFQEYLKAWILIHLLRDRLGWGEPKQPGFIFNMSVGYNLEGIKSPPVQRFLDKMVGCGAEKAELIAQLAGIYPRIGDLDIPDRISDSVTVSTMHGCPPEEVEKIGRYFIRERRLHTTIKLNPTLLGRDRVREILNHRLGYPVEVPEAAFGHDLKYPDGAALIRTLGEEAKAAGVEFNLKLTNTLETTNQGRDLPPNEAMVYLSGRPLHPLGINLAARLQEDFGGALDLSFSAGVDCYNFPRTLAAGLAPITVCSDLLKPGGYGRLSQYLEELGRAMAQQGAGSIEEFILARAGETELRRAGLRNLRAYAAQVAGLPRYAKAARPWGTVKTGRELPLLDCAGAPCVEACAAGQEIPRYLDFMARGETDKAFATILATNPLPRVQGLVCDRQCRTKCTRINYDRPLMIREIKRFAAQSHQQEPALAPAPPPGIKAAVIGAGPSGLSCVHYLALAGVEVDLWEAGEEPGGMAARGIPSFRLDRQSLEQDAARILSLGVNFHQGRRIGPREFEELRQSHDYVYIAVGAQESLTLNIPGIEGQGVLDQLSFLAAVARGRAPELGRRVGVVGGGNSALDAARTAKRLVGPKGEVTIFYRRTKREMPADPEEIREALAEGIGLELLCAPERVILREGRVAGFECSRMELGQPDASGRPRPVKLECSQFTVELDSLIQAIGQRVVLDFLPEGRLAMDPPTLRTGLERVLAGGDAVRGASSLIQAIADGKKAAEAVIREAGLDPPPGISPPDDREPDWKDLAFRQARRSPEPPALEASPQAEPGFGLETKALEPEQAQAQAEAGRCLQCDLLCNICVSVCPNRANLALETEPQTFPIQAAFRDGEEVRIRTLEEVRLKDRFQIVNLADFCNECGNCATFCPTAGAPYQDKARFHLSAESFESDTRGYHFPEPHLLEVKQDGFRASLIATERGYAYESDQAKVFLGRDLRAERVVFKEENPMELNLLPAVETALLFRLARKAPPFSLTSSKPERRG